MSKTFGKNWIAPVVRAFSKRSAALATGFASRYRADPFFRTGFNIIVLQVLFALLILVFVGIAFNYLYHDISVTLIEQITESIVLREKADASVVAERLRAVRTENLAMISGVVIFATVIIGYLLTRITLAPARNALAAQKQFIGNIAHELRTPLAIIKTNTEVALLDADVDPSIQKTMHSNIEELDRISEIINNLLTFTVYIRPERMEFKNVDLHEVVDAAVKKLTPMAQRKQVDIFVQTNDFRIVWGNAIALQQIVMNLTKNAISYTPEQGRVTITIEPNYNGFIELVVKDTGIGIARKDLDHIFEPFYRAERSRNRRKGGSGLGLAIVNELVKMHGGSIQILSAPSRGTAVTLLIPCGKRQSDSDLDETKKFEGYSAVAADFSQKYKTDRRS